MDVNDEILHKRWFTKKYSRQYFYRVKQTSMHVDDAILPKRGFTKK